MATGADYSVQLEADHTVAWFVLVSPGSSGKYHRDNRGGAA